jgi:hypothetical protein
MLTYRVSVPSLVILLITGLNGCVAVDSRAARESDHASGALLQGSFYCGAVYMSHKSGLVGPSNLREVFNDVPCDTVTISLIEGSALEISFEKDGATVNRRTIDHAAGFRVDKSNVVTIGTKTCGGGEGVGCYTTKSTFFMNADGDLVVIQSGVGAGLLTILPYAQYAKLMGIFPKSEHQGRI